MSLAGRAIKSIDGSTVDGAGTPFEAEGCTYFTAVLEASTGTCSLALQGSIGTSTHYFTIAAATTYTTAGGILATTRPYALTSVRAVSSTVATTGGITVWLSGA